MVKSIKADVDVQAAVYKSKLLQDWTTGIGRIGDTSQWSYKDAALSAKLQESRKDEVLRGLLQVCRCGILIPTREPSFIWLLSASQVGDFGMILETPVGRANLSTPFTHRDGKAPSQRPRTAIVACGDLNLPSKPKEEQDPRPSMEDVFSYTARTAGADVLSDGNFMKTCIVMRDGDGVGGTVQAGSRVVPTGAEGRPTHAHVRDGTGR